MFHVERIIPIFKTKQKEDNTFEAYIENAPGCRSGFGPTEDIALENLKAIVRENNELQTSVDQDIQKKIWWGEGV